MFDVVRDSCRCLPTIPRTLLTQVTSTTKDLLSPCLVLFLVIKTLQRDPLQLSKSDSSRPTSQCKCLCISVAAPALSWRNTQSALTRNHEKEMGCRPEPASHDRRISHIYCPVSSYFFPGQLLMSDCFRSPVFSRHWMLPSCM